MIDSDRYIIHLVYKEKLRTQADQHWLPSGFIKYGNGLPGDVSTVNFIMVIYPLNMVICHSYVKVFQRVTMVYR